MKFVSILQNKTVRNAGWIIGGRLTNKVIAFLVSILTARYLGPKDYGLINYAAAYTTFFASLCTLGINSIIIKNFVDHPGEEGLAIGSTLVMRVVSSFLSAVMIIGIVSIVDRDEPLTVLVVALSCVELLFQALDTFKQWFQSRLESRYSALAAVVGMVASSVYKVFLLATGKPVTWFALGLAVDYAASAAVLIAVYRKKKGPRLSVSAAKGRQLLSKSYSFIISGVMVAIFSGTDRLMLKHLLNEESVACYSLAISLSTAWAFVLDAMIQSAYPTILKLHGKNRELFEKRNRQLYALVFYTAVAASLLISLVAEPAVRLLYGEVYLPAVRPLRIVAWYTAFSYLGGARSAWMVCENKQIYLNIIYGCAACMNVILNLVLIPFWGASGAALATLVTQMGTGLLLPLLLPKLRPNAILMLEALTFRKVF